MVVKFVRGSLFFIFSSFLFYWFKDHEFSGNADVLLEHKPDSLLIYFLYSLDYIFKPILVLYMAFAISGLIVKVFFAEYVPKEYSAQVSGVINYIDFSGVRVNGVPMAEVSVTYLGMEKVFSPLPKRFRIHFDKGDTVIIAHHPDDISQSIIDIDASIAA